MRGCPLVGGSIIGGSTVTASPHTYHQWTGMEGSVLEIKWPVVDNMAALPMNRPHLPTERGHHDVIVAVSINIKQKGCGNQGGVS